MTELAPVSADPLTVTVEPSWPLAGANPVTCGSGGAVTPTVKGVELLAVPFRVATWIGPLVAPLGTVR